MDRAAYLIQNHHVWKKVNAQSAFQNNTPIKPLQMPMDILITVDAIMALHLLIRLE